MYLVASHNPAKISLSVRRRQVRAAIQHAKLICKDHEDTSECRAAWIHANKMTYEFRKEVQETKLLDFLLEDIEAE